MRGLSLERYVLRGVMVDDRGGNSGRRHVVGWLLEGLGLLQLFGDILLTVRFDDVLGR